MIYLSLFWVFLKIGFTSFGGLSMIPLISSEMAANGWMTASEVSDLLAIADMTPGPMGLNCATFAGIRAAGVLGALAANLGVLAPSLTLTALAAFFFERFKKSSLTQKLMVGVRPATLAMVIGVCLTLSLSNYSADGVFSPLSLAIGILAALLLFKFKLSIPKVIIISAAAGILLFGVLPLIQQ